ncbi:c-type cytochrome domain-containing protein [Maribacter algicola]|uniref:C-type cytochrome domain-containing protein n=1 Tax=Meishania litoralis TaxID=3434685 RepID=A0ACC7LG04_9FLAO
MIALEFTTFIGRFHPLFVHLPIGFIILAILLEGWESFKKKGNPSRLIPIAWFIGGLASFVAALCGWFLGETGLYIEEQLFLHRWLGIALVPIAFIGWWIKRAPEQYPKQLQHGFNILLIVLLSVEGHKGGNLTHGETYLTEFAPEPIRNLFTSQKDSVFNLRSNNPDSVIVYTELIQPIFQAKCVSCHGNEVKRGALNMSHPDSLSLGGDGGDVIVPGNLEDSELFRRITLPQKNVKFMPPTSNVLTYDEIKTIAWWIEQGALFESRVSELEVDKNLKPVLLRRYGLNTTPRPWYEKVQVAPLDSTQIALLMQQGFSVKTLGANNPLLDVGYKGTDLSPEKLVALEPAKEHITWFSLTGTNIKDEWLSGLSGFVNLTRLELDKTSISDLGIAHLNDLSHLEVLNLYASQVSDACLPILQELPALKRAYLSRTKVTFDKAKAIEDEDGLTIIIAENVKN